MNKENSYRTAKFEASEENTIEYKICTEDLDFTSLWLCGRSSASAGFPVR